MSFGTIATFILYIVAMLAIGVICYRRNRNLNDFILGSRGLNPGVAARSAGASDMSGWLLLGLPGAVYASGLNQMWIAVGLVIGAYLNWQFAAARLRIYTQVARDALTIPDYLDNRFQDRSRTLRVLTAVVILLFFTFTSTSRRGSSPGECCSSRHSAWTISWRYGSARFPSWLTSSSEVFSPCAGPTRFRAS